MSAAEESSRILTGLTANLPDKDPEETAEWLSLIHI